MPTDDVGVAEAIAGRVTQVILGRHIVSFAGEGELEGLRRATRDLEIFAVLLILGEQRVELFGVVGWHKDVRCTCIDDGGLATQLGRLPSDAGVVDRNLPQAGRGDGFRVRQIADELGRIPRAKGRLAIIGVVRRPLDIDPDHVGLELRLRGEHAHDRRQVGLGRIGSRQAQHPVHRVAEELVRYLRRRSEGHGEVETGHMNGVVDHLTTDGTLPKRQIPRLTRGL